MNASNHRRGFNLLELFIVVAAVAVLGVLFLPRIVRPRVSASHWSCLSNQKQIALCFKVWALDNQEKFPAQVSITNGGVMELVSAGAVWPHFNVMSNELSTPRILVCPSDTNRISATAFQSAAAPPPGSPFTPLTNDSRVSYFVGVDARDDLPTSVLTGDRFIGVNGGRLRRGLASIGTNQAVAWVNSWHGGQGYVALVDGSVQQLNSPGLARVFEQSGFATNRIAVP